MQMNSSDAVVVRLLERVKVLEKAAQGAMEYLDRDPSSSLAQLISASLLSATENCEIARRNFRYGHDCTEAKCDPDSHK